MIKPFETDNFETERAEYLDRGKRMVLTKEAPEALFRREPMLMLELIALAAETDFDLHQPVHEAMVADSSLLQDADKAQIRDLFGKIITSEYAGKGLRMLAGCELIPQIVGEPALKMSRRQLELFSELTEGIDRTKPVLNRRLGLFYQCFEKKGEAAVDFLPYDSRTRQHLIDALHLMERIFFMANKIELKQFLVEYGMERYEYIDNLAKAQLIVYGQGEVKIKNRYYMMKDIVENGEPVFVEDLAIDAEDLIEENIADAQQAEQILLMLTDVVHRKPGFNTRKTLLEHARKFAGSRMKATFRRVKWIK